MLLSIRKQLTIIICSLISLAMVSTLMISYSLIFEDYEQKMHYNNSAMAESLASNISQFLQNAYNINQLVTEYPDLASLPAVKQQQLLVDTTRQYPFFQLLAIHKLSGDQTARSSGALANRSERWWFKKFVTERQPYISKTYYSVFSESPITTIVHGIYANGDLAGILMADIEIKKLQQMVENYNSGAGSYAYLLDGEGAVIAHPDRQQVADLYNYKTLKKKVLLRDADGKMLKDEKNNEITQEVDIEVTPSLEAIVAKVTAGEIGEGYYTDVNGEEYMCAYRAISLPGKSSPWSLIVVQKKSAAMAFVNSVALKTTGIGILVIIFSLLLTIWFSRKLTRPLLAIVAATDQIKEGNLAIQLTVSSPNEVGVLAANFNQMICELERHRDKLEELVEERTGELAAANQEMLAMNEELTAMNETLEDTNQRLLDENQARRQTENNLLLRERQYRAITGLLTRSTDEMGDILENILHNAVELLNAVAGYIGLYDAAGNVFYIHHSIGLDADCISSPLPANAGLQGQVYATGDIYYLEDYRKSPQRLDDNILSCSTSSVIMVPLKQADKVQGVLTVSWRDVVHPINKEDLEGLRQFADLASVALEQDTIQKKIRQIAFHDTLTGLPNRPSLNAYLKEEMAKARGKKAKGVILFIDIDDFKSVNDSFGHSFGDNVIVSASQRIVAAIGKGAFVSRLGGDEFIVIAPGESSRERAARMAGRVTEELGQDYEIAAQRVHMSASIGVVLYPEDGDMAEDILKKADIAMYAAKQAGRNCWRFYEPILLQKTYEKLLLTNGLRRGLERGEFSLYYQPQFTVTGDEVIGFEALLRWVSPEHGLVPPDRFIPLAEQSGLILPIGQWVLQEACRFARRLADLGQENLCVAVNISPRQLLSEDFVTNVRDGIIMAGIKPNQLEIEITESVFIESMEDAVVKLRQLQAIGVTLSLDDFGTGYSSLTYLRNLPVGILKIDKSFIDKIITDEMQLQVVGSIIDLGHNLGLTIVAEGVENREQLSILTEAGCDRIQGYLFSKPLVEEAAVRLLS
ncbi:EAL domain-containing protein [Sporomusa aerivorans]|uniref:bifunctional diguanylate cyclase/phosphodiesterase n=1 Tax=Sporomusa aerivorans TaxID=204936 RepID=UPI00352B8EEA